MSNNKPTYKTSRKYKCPYCNFSATRVELIDHVEKKHEELIPEGYTAVRAVYDSINGKNYGTCMICGKRVYKWNDKVNRYYNLCDSKECKAKVREIALERHIRVYNKPTLLNDPEQQEKMLANRRISGTYTFTDGTKMTYTGKYERNALEFMDKVLGIPANDIQTPGPVLEYEYNGQTHKWITDIYYIPANLLIEIKDGGSNPNNRSMVSYREKQVAKEQMVTSIGTFNYVRLTNNDFAQLLDVLADIKNEALNTKEGISPKAKIHINEEVGGLPRQGPPEAYIIPYGMNHVFDGFAYSDSDTDSIYTIDDDGKINHFNESEFDKNFETGDWLVYKESDSKEKIKFARQLIESGKASNKFQLAEIFTGRQLHRPEEIAYSECFSYYSKKDEDIANTLIENAIVKEAEEITSASDSNIVKIIGNVYICIAGNGRYYASTPKDMYLVSKEFSDVETLISSGVVDVMNNIYKANKMKKDQGGNGNV